MNNGEFLKHIGNKVKQTRKKQGLTVRRLAALCGTDYSNLSRFENGQKDAHILTLKNIAEKLKMDIKELM